jgi:hypothetical protein
MLTRKIADELDARACLDKAKVARPSAGARARPNGADGRSPNIWRVRLERAESRRGAGRSLASDAPRFELVELVPRPERVESGSVTHMNIGGVTTAALSYEQRANTEAATEEPSQRGTFAVRH